MLKLPTIDISGLPDDESAVKQLSRASETYGCFHVVNHGIPATSMDRFFDHMRAFFALDEADLQALSRTSENPWGYFDRELTKNTRDWKRIYDYGRDSVDGPFSSRAQWPAEVPDFKEVMLDWFDQCEKLSARLLDTLCRGLGMPAGTLGGEFSPEHSSFVRLNYYPPCSDPAPPGAPTGEFSGKLGINYHTDAGALTVLAHDDVPSLQVRFEDNWHIVEPRPDGFFINVGDMMQVWSNGRYPAVEHRVLANADRERFSAPFFYNPSYSTVCRPLPSTIQDSPARYRDVQWGEYRRQRADGDYANYGDEIQVSWYEIEPGG